MIAIGIDVGGTRTRVGVVNDAVGWASPTACIVADEYGGQCPPYRHFATAEVDSADALLDRLVDEIAGIIKQMRDHKEAAKPRRDREGACDLPETVPIGLALPGVVDRTGGQVVRSVNLPFLEGFPIAEELARRTARRVIPCTDAEAATWGEYSATNPHPVRFVHLRLGTGVACGVVINGRLHPLDRPHNPKSAIHNPQSTIRTAHLDVLIVDHTPGAVLCRCGRHGCLETICSGYALLRRARDADIAGGIAGLRRAYTVGDTRATAIIRDAKAGLAVATGKIAAWYNPQIICIGGGLAEELKLDSPRSKSGVSIEPARLADSAGVIGAALLAMKQP